MMAIRAKTISKQPKRSQNPEYDVNIAVNDANPAKNFGKTAEIM